MLLVAKFVLLKMNSCSHWRRFLGFIPYWVFLFFFFGNNREMGLNLEIRASRCVGFSCRFPWTGEKLFDSMDADITWSFDLFCLFPRHLWLHLCDVWYILLRSKVIQCMNYLNTVKNGISFNNFFNGIINHKIEDLPDMLPYVSWIFWLIMFTV